MLGSYEKTKWFDFSNCLTKQKVNINLTKVYEQLGAEKANTLIGFHYFSGCNTVEKFNGKS